jgi:alkaline phosphatase D
MTGSFVFKTDRPWPNARLREGLIVGHTTATSAKVWVRTGQPGAFSLLCYPTNMPGAEAFRQRLGEVPFAIQNLPAGVQRLRFKITNFDRDTTHVAEVTGLLPLTDYSNALHGPDSAGNTRILLGHDIGGDTLRYSFRTLGAAARPLSFGFYSCHMPYTESIFGRLQVNNMDMWDSLARTLRRHREHGRLGFLIGGGDQVYADGVKKLSIWNFLNACLENDPATLPGRDAMLSWYRDIYRGYWGFPQIREIFSQTPTYMIWDDHELGDGWGSYFLKKNAKNDEMDEIFPKWKKLGLQYEDCVKLRDAMGDCAKQVYREYQHGHNPENDGHYDYGFSTNGTALYFLDGRGHRDINQKAHRTLGKDQMDRVAAWIAALDPSVTPFVFIVSAVPLMHLQSAIANADNPLVDAANLEDDLRDAWEHPLHDKERKELVRLLFDAAQRGLKVSILSGDVHVSAVFRLTDARGNIIYQLTCSAITYNVSQMLGWMLGGGVADSGDSGDGYGYKRLALFLERNYAMIQVDPNTGAADFQLYGPQSMTKDEGKTVTVPVTHSMAKIELTFKRD